MSNNKCWECDKSYSTGYFCGFEGTSCSAYPGIDFINPDHPCSSGKECDKFVPKKFIPRVVQPKREVAMEDIPLAAECISLRRKLEAAEKMIAELLPVSPEGRIDSCFGVPMDRVYELCTADKEGRCVIYPRGGVVAKDEVF